MANKKTASLVLARVLVDTVVFGEQVKPDDLVEGSAKQIDHLVKASVVDKHPDAVKYALNLDGNRKIQLVDADATAGDADAAEKAEAAEKARQLEAAIKALDDEIAGLEQKLGEAAEEEKAAIETQIAAKREELKELQG